MRDITSIETQAVTGGTIVCGEMISTSLLQGLQEEAMSDARKAAVAIGGLSLMFGLWAGLPVSTTLLSTVAIGSVAYNYEYTSSMSFLNPSNYAYEF